MRTSTLLQGGLCRFLAAPIQLALIGAAPLGVMAQPQNLPNQGAHAAAEGVSLGAVDTRLEWWQEARFGMFIHFGLYAIPAGKWGEATSHGEWIRDTAKIPKDEYSKFLAQFNPVDFDAKAIVQAAKEAGMGYIVITSKHHDGFALFDSKASDFDVMATPFKRDIMKELAQAAQDQDVRMCWYYSIMDWYHPDYQPRRPWEPAVRAGESETKPDFDRYTNFMKAQLRELLTAYGNIGVLWFDGQWEHNWNNVRGRDLYQFVRQLQPNIIINSRVGREGGDFGLDRTTPGLGDYATPEQVIPDKAITHQPWETCMTMNRHWGFNAADQDFKSTTDLIRKLCDIAGKGGNFLLNVGPDARGRIPTTSLERLKEIGKWMNSHGDAIRGTIAGPLANTPTWGAVTAKALPAGDTRLYVHIFDGPGEYLLPGLLNRVKRVQVIDDESKAGIAKVSSTDSGVVVTLDAMTNAHATVVMLDLEGDPNVAVAPTIEAYSDIFVDELKVHLFTTQRDVQIHYTTNGTEPSQYSPHEVPLVLNQSATVVARPFANGKPAGPASTREFKKQTPSQPSTKVAHERQLQCEIFNGAFTSVMDFDNVKAVQSSTVTSLDLSARPQDNNWGMRWRGVIQVPKRGIYRFHLGSDDGSMLWINDQVVVDNDKPHSFRFRQGDVALDEGAALFELRFFENTGGFDLKLEWESPDAGLTRTSVPVHVAK